MKKFLASLVILVVVLNALFFNVAMADEYDDVPWFPTEEEIQQLFVNPDIVSEYKEWYGNNAWEIEGFVNICDLRGFLMDSFEGAYGDLGVYYGSKEGWYVILEKDKEDIELAMRYEDVIFEESFPYLHLSVLCRLYRACEN